MVLLLAMLGPLVTSCGDKLNHAQYRITPAVTSDRARVSRVLDSVANKAELSAQQPPPFAGGSFVYYDNVVVHGPTVDLFARADQHGILIDLEGGTGPKPSRFAESERLLDQRLPAVFGARCLKNTRLE